MKDDIRNALATGEAMTARELFAVIEPEDIQRLHEALSAMRKAGEIENGPERTNSQGGRALKTWRMAECAEEILADSAPMGSGKSADAVAALRMMAAEEDDAEACLDEAGSSHNGDEFEWTPEMVDRRKRSAEAMDDEWALRPITDEDMAFEADLLMARQIADQSLIDVAAALLAGHPVWAAAQRMHRAVTGLADDYA